jgi:hypothetical protein
MTEGFPGNARTRFEELPMEMVEWVDHHGDIGQGFHTASEWVWRLREKMVIRTVGMVLHEDEEAVTLCMEQRGDIDLDEAAYRQTGTIMKRLIIRRVVLVPRAFALPGHLALLAQLEAALEALTSGMWEGDGGSRPFVPGAQVLAARAALAALRDAGLGETPKGDRR